MANTVTQRTLYGAGDSRYVVRSVHILSDGSEETDLVIYDNSAFIADATKGSVEEIWISGNASTVRLEWDQTTDAPVFAGNPANAKHFNYSEFGGISNPAGTGATGDLVLTTAGLDAGDEVYLVVKIRQE